MRELRFGVTPPLSLDQGAAKNPVFSNRPRELTSPSLMITIDQKKKRKIRESVFVFGQIREKPALRECNTKDAGVALPPKIEELEFAFFLFISSIYLGEPKSSGFF